VEVEESVAALTGDGPPDLMRVTLALAEQMLALAGIEADPAAALADGRAYRTFRAMVSAQGGDPDAPLPRAAHVIQALPAPADGWLADLDALKVGTAAWRLGAGRARKEDQVSATAGVICLAKPGDRVQAGQPLVELRSDRAERFGPALAALEGAIAVTAQNPRAALSPIIERIPAA
jgi:thymidine phosphorylase